MRDGRAVWGIRSDSNRFSSSKQFTIAAVKEPTDCRISAIKWVKDISDATLNDHNSASRCETLLTGPENKPEPGTGGSEEGTWAHV